MSAAADFCVTPVSAPGLRSQQTPACSAAGLRTRDHPLVAVGHFIDSPEIGTKTLAVFQNRAVTRRQFPGSSGGMAAAEPSNIPPPDKTAETRAVVTRLAASRRVVTHGLIIPSRGTRAREEMERQARDLGVEPGKGYTEQLLDGRAWTVDDEKAAQLPHAARPEKGRPGASR